MKVWSKGLGKTELRVDCRYYLVRPDSETETVYIIGKITDPVDWEFRATLEPDDIPGLLKLGLTYPMVKLFLKNLYKYLLYLPARRKYAEAVGPDLEAHVDAAYASLMNGRPRRQRLAKQPVGVAALNPES